MPTFQISYMQRQGSPKADSASDSSVIPLGKTRLGVLKRVFPRGITVGIGSSVFSPERSHLGGAE